MKDKGSAKTSLKSTVADSSMVSLASMSADSAAVSIRVPLAELASKLSALSSISKSAVVHIQGKPRMIASVVASLSKKVSHVSARIGFSARDSVAAGISGKKPVE